MEHEQQHLGTAEAGALAAQILADLDATPDTPCPPLFQAVEHERIEEVRRLIAEGADVNCALGGGWTPLAHAIDIENDVALQRYNEPGHESTTLTELLLAAGAVPTEEAFRTARYYRSQKAVAMLEKYQRHADPGTAPDCGVMSAFLDS